MSACCDSGRCERPHIADLPHSSVDKITIKSEQLRLAHQEVLREVCFYIAYEMPFNVTFTKLPRNVTCCDSRLVVATVC